MTKILVIEDNSMIRKEVLTWLSLEEYEALGAANGREGVEIALQQIPDLILSDIMMPEKDGYHVLAELRIQPRTALIPFIFMTAKQEKADIRYGMQLGADDYITKPFGREELLSTIRTRLIRRDLFIQDSDKKGRELRHHLLHMLPHELRTPLVGILGIGELLSQNAESLTHADIVDYAEIITDSGRQLYRLIQNHLLYAQLVIAATDPYTNSSTTGLVPVPVATIIQDTSEEIAQTYKRLDDLSLDLRPGVVRMTGDHLSKIVHELVDNAFKFSETPTPVRVSGERQMDKYVVVVSDQGRGLTPENIAQIDAYIQFERQTYEQQGAGLGLTLARRLAEFYGGS
ncbi:MAG: response regulator, partial [Chloroflexi bacterium]|nr:response regulator [Chloroflexota bacterium]